MNSGLFEMFHVKHILFSLQSFVIILELMCAMKEVEPGQDWKIAALIFNFHVHFYFGVIL